MYWEEMSYYKLIPKSNQQRLRDEYEPDCGEELNRDEEIDYDAPKGDD